MYFGAAWEDDAMRATGFQIPTFRVLRIQSVWSIYDWHLEDPTERSVLVHGINSVGISPVVDR